MRSTTTSPRAKNPTIAARMTPMPSPPACVSAYTTGSRQIMSTVTMTLATGTSAPGSSSAPPAGDRDLAQTQQRRPRADQNEEDDHDEDEPSGHEHVLIPDRLTHEVDEADRQRQPEVPEDSEDDADQCRNQRFGHGERGDLGVSGTEQRHRRESFVLPACRQRR